MELAPFPCGRLPGFRRASPSTPLDAYCYVARSISSTFGRTPSSEVAADGVTTVPAPVFRLAPHGRHLHRSARAPRGGARRRAQARPASGCWSIVNPYATTVSDRLQEPGRLRPARQLRGRRDRHRGPRPRDRAVPRGGARGLRRRRRVRRRRHRQRGGQRAGRLGHAAELPARRPHQRLLPDARDPDRRRRRDRAPAADRRRLAPAGGRPRRRSTTASSCSRPASGSTRASSSASTPTRG